MRTFSFLSGSLHLCPFPHSTLSLPLLLLSLLILLVFPVRRKLLTVGSREGQRGRELEGIVVSPQVN